MTLYAIQCRFQVSEDSAKVDGIALCSDADTPVTFIYPDGKPYIGEDIWDYRLKHTYPWMKVLE